MLWYGGGVACTQPETPAPTTYTITFDSGVESISVEEGAVAKEPAKPTKDGYEFIEWLNGTEAYDWALPVTSNLSLTAKWSAIKYTITYLPDGVKTDNPTNYTIESETITLKDPTLEEGKYFIAWHVDTEEGNVETEIAKGSTGNKTFYAEISSEKPCVVTFNDGTKKLTSVNTKKDSKVTLPTGYEKKYNFFSDKECKKAFDITTPITADTTIYVKVKTFTVTFDSGVEAVTVEYEGTVKEPTAPTNGDKVFVGWYDGDNKFDFTTKITKDIKLTAKWAVTAIDTLWAAKDTAVTNPVTLPGWGYVSSYVDDKEFGKVLALNLPEGTADAGWCRFAVEFPEAKDLSDKIIKVVFKADGDTKGQIKPIIYSSETSASEHNSTNVITASTDWEYKYAAVNDMWTEYSLTEKADITVINKIELDFQTCPANLQIAQLSICDDCNNTNEEIIWSANALSVANPYEKNATVEYVDDSVYTKVYKVDANGSYGVTTVSLPAPAKDLTAYEYLQITLKSSVATGTNVKVCIFSDATHGSENNGCTITEDELGEWKTIRLKLSEFWTAWSSDSSIKEADLSKISSLEVNYGPYNGTLEIADISLVKIELE